MGRSLVARSKLLKREESAALSRDQREFTPDQPGSFYRCVYRFIIRTTAPRLIIIHRNHARAPSGATRAPESKSRGDFRSPAREAEDISPAIPGEKQYFAPPLHPPRETTFLSRAKKFLPRDDIFMGNAGWYRPIFRALLSTPFPRHEKPRAMTADPDSSPICQRNTHFLSYERASIHSRGDVNFHPALASVRVVTLSGYD